MQETQEMAVWSLGQGRSPGGGNGNPLQYSCLKHPMDGGACGLQSLESQRVKHGQAAKHTHCAVTWCLGKRHKCLLSTCTLLDIIILLRDSGSFCIAYSVLCDACVFPACETGCIVLGCVSVCVCECMFSKCAFAYLENSDSTPTLCSQCLQVMGIKQWKKIVKFPFIIYILMRLWCWCVFVTTCWQDTPLPVYCGILDITSKLLGYELEWKPKTFLEKQQKYFWFGLSDTQPYGLKEKCSMYDKNYYNIVK